MTTTLAPEPKPAPEMTGWDYALFAAREFWLDLGREINDHTMAANAMAIFAATMLTEGPEYVKGESEQ